MHIINYQGSGACIETGNYLYTTAIDVSRVRPSSTGTPYPCTVSMFAIGTGTTVDLAWATQYSHDYGKTWSGASSGTPNNTGSWQIMNFPLMPACTHVRWYFTGSGSNSSDVAVTWYIVVREED